MTTTSNDVHNAYGEYSDGSSDERYMREEIEAKFNIPEGELDEFLLLHRTNARRYDHYNDLRKQYEAETGESWA